jgi:signal transduction histidine kinase
VETTLVTCLLVSTTLWAARFRRTRRSSDLLLAVAILMLALYEFAFLALPTIGGFGQVPPAGSPMVGRVLVAIVFLAAAMNVRRSRLVSLRRAGLVAAAAVVCIAASWAGGLLAPHEALMTGALWAQPNSTLAIALTVSAVGMMLLAAVHLARAGRQRAPAITSLVLNATVLLAAAWIFDLGAPLVAPGWLSGREALRGMAYACILVAALRIRSAEHRADCARAVLAERRRLASDLHDGLAQDLAFIVMQGREIEQRLGGQHQIVSAARRALRASRGAIINLSAAQASTGLEALESVARELADRYGVDVVVESDGTELDGHVRDEVVRIAREAVLNAIKHGAASHVLVSLKTQQGHTLLEINDDGVGISPAEHGNSRRGYGMRAMRDRAERLGGSLVIRRGTHRGTVVELLMRRKPGRAP